MKHAALFTAIIALLSTSCIGQALSMGSRTACERILCKTKWISNLDSLPMQKEDYIFTKDGKCNCIAVRTEAMVWFFDTTDTDHSVRKVYIGDSHDDAMPYFLVDVAKIKRLTKQQIDRSPMTNMLDIQNFVSELNTTGYILILGRTLRSTYNKKYYYPNIK